MGIQWVLFVLTCIVSSYFLESQNIDNIHAEPFYNQNFSLFSLPGAGSWWIWDPIRCNISKDCHDRNRYAPGCRQGIWYTRMSGADVPQVGNLSVLSIAYVPGRWTHSIHALELICARDVVIYWGNMDIKQPSCRGSSHCYTLGSLHEVSVPFFSLFLDGIFRVNVSKEPCRHTPVQKPVQECVFSPTGENLELKSKLQLNDRTQFIAFIHMTAYAHIWERLCDPAFNMEIVDTRRKYNCDLKLFWPNTSLFPTSCFVSLLLPMYPV